MTPPDTLRRALTALLIAYEAPRGGKPTGRQLDEIAYRSGAAAAAITYALEGASRLSREASH